ncbi:Dcp2, box A domain-containing protein [Myxozyma melibiosi]|uniref:Dcp2, box A domain-containing protein n=1 Tax=Myxozyma melibiosi TaxID=54550 RepID=A0ABR1FFR9_9ASCO
MTIRSSFNFATATLDEVLDDLSVRFIQNCPPEELTSVERVCFQAEEAHWFYEDFIRAENPQLPSLSQKNFTARIFTHCPLLRKWSDVHEQAFADFMQYKTRVPVRGAILLNKNLDKCILVKGWKSSASWGFPKGKINKGEPDEDCAIREVIEETGYDVSALLKKEDYINITIREQQLRLYIIAGVPMDAAFEPQTRKEISKIEWFKLSSLPTYGDSRDAAAAIKNGQASKKFYMVAPFMKQLLRWVNEHKPPKPAKKTVTYAEPVVAVPAVPSNTMSIFDQISAQLKTNSGPSTQEKGAVKQKKQNRPNKQQKIQASPDTTAQYVAPVQQQQLQEPQQVNAYTQTTPMADTRAQAGANSAAAQSILSMIRKN